MGMVLAVCLAMVLGSAFFAYKGGSRICNGNEIYFGGLSDVKKPTGTMRMEQDRLLSVVCGRL